MTGREILLYLSYKYKGDSKKIIDAIKAKERVEEENVKDAVENTKSKFMTIIDDDYPTFFKTIYNPPLVIYYYGDINLFNKKGRLSVVGSRDCSDYGVKATSKLVKDVAKEKIIVSGLARGIDSIAHRTCIESGNKTIAVLGSGIDYPYPKENIDLYNQIKNEHLLISEYPGETLPNPENFPLRNRLVTAIGDALLVTEAYCKSGTNISVFYAMQQGKDVMTIPYPIGKSSSCNQLIKDGATLVETSDDILFNMKEKN